MTVRELLEHFNIYPDKICYYDELNNIQDTVNIACVAANGEKSHNSKAYKEFMSKYGNRNIWEWNYGYDNMLDLSF